MGEYMGCGMVFVDGALLFGCCIYEHMYLHWFKQIGLIIDYFNCMCKYVVSTTLQELLLWENSILLRGVDEVVALDGEFVV